MTDILVKPAVIESPAYAPSEAEVDAWLDRLGAILGAGGGISLVQVYTLARPPAEPWVTGEQTLIMQCAAAGEGEKPIHRPARRKGRTRKTGRRDLRDCNIMTSVRGA